MSYFPSNNNLSTPQQSNAAFLQSLNSGRTEPISAEDNQTLGFSSQTLKTHNFDESVYPIVASLLDPSKRKTALSDLQSIRDKHPNLAIILWNSFGVVSALLQEIIYIYPILNMPTLSYQNASRACNALAILQCIASHEETRLPFLKSQIVIYLFPFLSTNFNTKAFDFLRLTSLGVIGALVKGDNTVIITTLLNTEIVPLCLRIMEQKGDLSKTVAIFIVQRILADPTGLEFACHTFERFEAISTALNEVCNQLTTQQSQRVLRHVIRCYYYLSLNNRACTALQSRLPQILRSNNLAEELNEDVQSKRYLGLLLNNVLNNVPQERYM